MTFVDAVPELVTALHRGRYPHDTVSSAGRTRKMIEGCTAIPAQNQNLVAEAVAASDVVFTSVGAQSAADRAVTRSRHHSSISAGGGALDVFLAENVHDGAKLLRSLLEPELERLGAAPQKLLETVGIVETSIGRMIPVPSPEQLREHPALVAVEPYRELPFDVAVCRAPVPDVPDLVGNPDVDFSFYTARKLYVRNQGHCLTAYLGASKGYTQIVEAIANPEIVEKVRAAMMASALALAAKYNQPRADLTAHVEDLIHRFGNTALHDTVERVGRDPERKLQPGERFLGALELTSQWGNPEPLIDGIALAVLQVPETDVVGMLRLTAQVGEEVLRLTPELASRFEQVLARGLTARRIG